MRLGFRQDSSITLSNVVGLNGLRTFWMAAPKPQEKLSDFVTE